MLGHDAVHLSEQGLERLTDSGIVKKARQEGRIVLVHDLGFGELVAASGATLPSVITFRLRNMHPDRVHGALHSILSQHGGNILNQAGLNRRNSQSATIGVGMSVAIEFCKQFTHRQCKAR
jgi:predicted nuclease of predicted toxin-antitoxin system